jgi:hypothetical protein
MMIMSTLLKARKQNVHKDGVTSSKSFHTTFYKHLPIDIKVIKAERQRRAGGHNGAMALKFLIQ